MPQPSPIKKHLIGPTALARTLAWLRLCAIAGQSVAVLFCGLVMNLPIPLLPLMAGIGVLAVFAAVAAWRINLSKPMREWETILHMSMDTLVLSFLLYCTGGSANPFITLLLVPIALSAAALSVRGLLIIAAITGVAYLVLLQHHLPLALNRQQVGEVPLYVIGLGVNFVITALLLGFFIYRLAHSVRLEQREIQRVRERALRDEGILAIATQAAGAAHELNTPLSTMLTLLPELSREHASDQPLTEDLQLLQEQVQRCRTILREMVAFGQAQLSQEPERVSVADFLHGCLERFQLLRPEADLVVTMDDSVGNILLRSPPGLRHALLNLLNNALDASALNRSHAVSLEIRRTEGWLELVVGDHGPGFPDDGHPVRLGRSGKSAGLGIGLALAEATAERLAGQLITRNTPRGAEMRLRLPLTVVAVASAARE